MTKIIMTRLILIRHSETDYNLRRKYCGFSNPPLNTSGIQQAQKAAQKLADIKVDKVYSSDLIRAVETANILFKNKLVEQYQDFREINFGIFEGLNHDQIVVKYRNVYENWINNMGNIKVSGAELMDAFIKRIRKRLAFILSLNKNKKIALVTHGGPIRVILSDALNRNLSDSFWDIEQGILNINIIEYSEDLSPKTVEKF